MGNSNSRKKEKDSKKGEQKSKNQKEEVKPQLTQEKVASKAKAPEIIQ
jgi:hypothetical protein